MFIPPDCEPVDLPPRPGAGDWAAVWNAGDADDGLKADRLSGRRLSELKKSQFIYNESPWNKGS
jgi:hypothetical protein